VITASVTEKKTTLARVRAEIFVATGPLDGIVLHHSSVLYRCVEENLRQSFRVLAAGRPRADVLELAGVSIASLGVSFQMFNAAFLSSPVETQADLERRLSVARTHFTSRGMPWSFWVCESWLSVFVQRRLNRSFSEIGMRLSSEMPGMVADTLRPTQRELPEVEIRPVADPRTLTHFRDIGSACFHVPDDWFSEVFDSNFEVRRSFVCWVGYSRGKAVATAASIASDGVIGIYNVATSPAERARGYAEAMTRYAIKTQSAANGASRVILQSTCQGLPLYERMGFRPVTRILVYNSR
jgi:hypothetical protein